LKCTGQVQQTRFHLLEPGYSSRVVEVHRTDATMVMTRLKGKTSVAKQLKCIAQMQQHIIRPILAADNAPKQLQCIEQMQLQDIQKRR
jgi:hypothetical protein